MHCHLLFHAFLFKPYYENEFDNRNTKGKNNVYLNTDTIERIPDKIIRYDNLQRKESLFNFMERFKMNMKIL